VVIDQNTEWVVRQPATPGRTVIDLIKGAILFFARRPRSLDIKTPFVNAVRAENVFGRSLPRAYPGPCPQTLNFR